MRSVVVVCVTVDFQLDLSMVPIDWGRYGAVKKFGGYS